MVRLKSPTNWSPDDCATTMRKAWARVSGAAVVAAISCAAEAQTTVEFKLITIVVGSAAGGGFDTHARVLAPHIRPPIPRQPSGPLPDKPGAPRPKARAT